MRLRSLGPILCFALLSCTSGEGPAPKPGPEGAGAAAPTGAALHQPGAARGVFTCPMCPGVARPSADACPRCGMQLVSTPTVLVDSCPYHPAALSAPASSTPGRCSFCDRPLVKVTMARTFACPDHPATHGEAGGACGRCGRKLEERFDPLPHGDHNPRHGGILFMCPDQFHHLEGAWPAPARFRLYFYDDFTRPIPAAGFRARALVEEQGAERPFDLQPAAGGGFLEAEIDGRAPPLSVTALVVFAGKEERFDFTFPALSVEPAAGSPSAPETAGNAPPSPPPAGAAISAPAIPSTLEETAAEILARDLRLRALMARGEWTRIFQPAMEAKDLALSLEERAAGWETDRRETLARAVRGLVRAAWLLDLAGDRGDGAKVREEYARFEESIGILKKLLPLLGEGG